MAIQSINPATGEVIESFTPLDAPAILKKIAAAHEAFLSYGEVPLKHRELWMRKLANLLDAEAQELGEMMTREMGKPIVAARAEAQKCATACRYYAEHAARMLAPEPIDVGGNDAYVRWDPLGAVLAVMPWNFPLWQVFRFLAPALMAGNVGLLKHASNVPRCALSIEELVRRAGFPSGVFQTLLIEASQVEMVLADERVAAVTVTGSESAGKAIAAQAGWLIKKSVLELGGSDPFVVMPSAELDAAVETGVRARCINNGQSCIAAKRFLIAASIYDAFETKFVAGMERLRVGDPMLEETEIGPLATAGQVETLEAQVHAAVSAGAKVLTGGERIAGQGNYYKPTVLTGLRRNSDVYRQEIFGPVAMLFRVRDVDEAIAIANESSFGLGASVWTRDAAEERRFVAELQCGSVFVNAMVASDPRLPFGGVKHSGYGRELSAAGMREFLNAKTVVVAEARTQAEQVRPADPEKVVKAAPVEAEAAPVAEANAIRRSRTTIRLKTRRN
jgi:succinate-semialdehyde dehydrogenase/glutarate-semialdehyde dehydrogenase